MLRSAPCIVLVLLPVLACAQQTTANEVLDVPAAIRAIKAYEDLLASSRITWWSSGTIGGMNIVTNSELSLSGAKKHRKDVDHVEGEPDRITVTVADGETHKTWTGSETDKVGSGMLFSAGSRDAPGLQEYLFRPYASDRESDFTKVEITEQSKDAVSIRRIIEGALYVDADYIRDGEYLKPRRYQYHPIQDGKPLNGTEFRYEYTADSDGRLKLTRIEQISQIHDVYGSLTITSVDLGPSFDPALFTFEFPADAPVRDMREGKQAN